MAEKKKINWVLILQGWAMLLVVIGHAFLGDAGKGPMWENSLFHFAYSFHMPLFMLVSGWLFYLTRLKINDLNGGGYKWPYCKLVKDKSLRLLLPGLVFSILAFAVKMAFPGEMSRQTGLSLNEIIHAFLYPNDNPFREMWFIATLFWFFLLTPIWRLVLSKEWLVWTMLALLLFVHFIHPTTEFLCIGRVFNYAIWFYLGLLISKEDLVEKWFAKKPWLTFIIGVIIYVIGKYTNPFVTTIGGIVFSFAFAILADKYIPKLFFSFRDYTYQIFLIGIFAQMFVKIIYRHISMPYVVAYLLCLVLGLYVPVLVSKLIEKINWKPLLLCVGLKPKK